MTGGDLNYLWSIELIQQLAEGGIRRFFVSPGSRSTPLALAVSSFQHLEKTVLIDERSAAFIALGASKTDRIPSALICTSGTAVANYLPAVVEAYMTRTPLLLLTANRPSFLQNIGSPQTIRQDGIFSHYASCVQLPDLQINFAQEKDQLKKTTKQIFQYFAKESRPFHLDIPFDKPLEPSAQLFRNTRIELNGFHPGEYPEPELFEWTTSINPIPDAKRPLFIGGPRAFAFYDFLAEPSFFQIPLLAEVTSQLSDLPNSIRGFDLFLRKPLPETHQPDVIFRLGKSPVNPALQRFLEQNRTIPIFTLQEDAEIDDAARNGVKPVSITAFENWLQNQTFENAWISRWRNVQGKAEAEMEASPAAEFTDGHVFRQLFGAESFRDWNLHLSNSMPVRDADLFGKDGWLGPVFCNRGASGIDGVLSTALGSSCNLEGNNLLLIGDVAFLHDSSALAVARQLNPDLLVILINNGGGTIFEMLPIAEHRDVFDTFFLTPRDINWKPVCEGFGIPYFRAGSQATFHEVLKEAVTLSGVRILEAVTHGNASMEERKKLWNSFTW